MEREKYIPEVKSQLRSRIMKFPVIYRASGIKVLGIESNPTIFH